MVNNNGFGLINTPQSEKLKIPGHLPEGFHGEQQGDSWLCPLDTANAAALRRHFPWTAPALTGLRKSAGCGDRLGLATPGHLMAIRETTLFPVLAQQSIREMQRSERTPQQVMDDVTWHVFRLNYQTGFGCDADHLKTTAAVDDCVAAGYIGFTLDPGEHVDNAAHSDDAAALRTKYAALPWDALQTTTADTLQRFTGSSPAGHISEEMVYRAACKYGRALAHVIALVNHINLRLNGQPYDLEISVDETDTPTSPFEHYFIAAELTRLNIRFQGLAPRFTGAFEKGVDYIGDLALFEADFAAHVRVLREFDTYKLSIHSGSDKFSLYPIIARHARERVHLKTAGTSWLEALRVIAMYNWALFGEMLDFARECYPRDRATYHVSADTALIPVVSDDRLPDLLNDFHARQVLHVTFGSLLAKFREPFFVTLHAHREDYWRIIQTHFQKHLAPFDVN